MDFKSKISVQSLLTSCGCNRAPNSVHWLHDLEIYIYAARNGIAIVSLEKDGSPQIISSKTFHKDRVNCVRWLTSLSGTPLTYHTFLSGGVDKALYLCKYHHDSSQVESVSCFKDTESSVVCCDGLEISPGCYLIASACGDSFVRIYRPDKDENKAVQSIKFGTGFILSLHMAFLPSTGVPVMACGGDDTKVHVFVWQVDQFVKVISLQGHEDWIRGLEFVIDDRNDLLLASCSQDCFVRIWRISESHQLSTNLETDEEIRLKQKLFSVKISGDSISYSVIVETVLYGHESWVYGVHWHPPIMDENGKRSQPMKILTASMDKTMIIWEPDAETGVWEEKMRVGEVGGNTLGLYGCQFSGDGKTVLAHGYQGAFTVWNLLNHSTDGERWCRGVAVSGHFSDVTDIAWDPNGHYILSTSADQTTRLFAPWKKTGNWHEMGRPQVHGYDLQCLAMIGRLGFASGADEKVVRVFQCPLNFLDNFQRLCDADLHAELEDQKKDGHSIAEGASVPALGLSNKAVFADKPAEMYADREVQPVANEQYSESAFRPLELNVPPSEDNLLQNTLWPETQKLYGHGFEIYALAANPQGTILASACKATKPDYAGIILWDTNTWQQITTLHCHTLTVVQMAFSPVSGNKLLSVSRDRTWALHQFDYKTGEAKLAASTDKKTAVHSRIIWSCCWTADEKHFLTASRDKKIVFWYKPESYGSSDNTSAGLNGYEACSQATFAQPVTAVSVAPVQDAAQRYLVAAGIENGEISMCCWNRQEGLTQLYTLNTSEAHHLTVRRLVFRPKLGAAGKQADGKNVIQLASCGQDHQVKVYNVLFTESAAVS